jgi:hypothetical protein
MATPKIAESAKPNVQDIVVVVPVANSVLMSISGLSKPILAVCPAPAVGSIPPDKPRISTTRSLSTEAMPTDSEVVEPVSLLEVPIGVD